MQYESCYGNNRGSAKFLIGNRMGASKIKNQYHESFQKLLKTARVAQRRGQL